MCLMNQVAYGCFNEYKIEILIYITQTRTLLNICDGAFFVKIVDG